MTLARPRSHPPSDTLTRFVEGTLEDRTAIADVVEHLSTCWECRQIVDAAAAFAEEESASDSPESNPQPARPMLVVAEDGALRTIAATPASTPARSPSRAWWLAVAAAAAIVIVASPFLLRWREQRRIDAAMRAVVAAAPAAERTIEPRLSGGFRWAQFRGAQRGPDEQTDEETIARGSAADLYDEVGKSSTPAALHAKGVALVVLGDAGNAVDALTAATKARPDDSRAWSDLAAAHYMVAMQNAAIERQHLAAAIAAADRALTLDPKLDEARFNRALAIELLRPAEAKQAWSDYLKHDATSPWAAEVREKHLSDTQP